MENGIEERKQQGFYRELERKFWRFSSGKKRGKNEVDFLDLRKKFQIFRFSDIFFG